MRISKIFLSTTAAVALLLLAVTPPVRAGDLPTEQVEIQNHQGDPDIPELHGGGLTEILHSGFAPEGDDYLVLKGWTAKADAGDYADWEILMEWLAAWAVYFP